MVLISSHHTTTTTTTTTRYTPHHLTPTPPHPAAESALSAASMTDSDGNTIVGTKEAIEHMPLLVLPVLSDDPKSLTVTYFSPAANATLRTGLRVSSITRRNATWATVVSSSARDDVQEVRVRNGQATALLRDGAVVDLCESKASCAALHVDATGEELAALAREAGQALVEAGHFDEEQANEILNQARRLKRGGPEHLSHARRRRRLRGRGGFLSTAGCFTLSSVREVKAEIKTCRDSMT